MGSREEYTECMKPYMTGGGPDRKERFCIGAKVCSGKAKTEDEARQICLSEPPKEAKPRKSRSKKSCGADMANIAACAAPKLKEEENLTFERVTEILQECACGKVSKVKKPIPAEKKFMQDCFKENSAGVPPTMKEFARISRFCKTEWKKQEAEAAA